MKKIIKYLLIVLLIFPLYSCKDNKLNEFGITSKLENELINAVYEYGEYEDYGHPIESLEILYYFGEIEGYHTYLCIAPYELNHLDVFIPYTFNTLDYYLYKNGEVFTLTYAVENNIITKESINYINSFLWLEENEKEKERVHSKENEIAINETLNEVYHEALGINTDNNKKLLYKYDFNYIEKYKGLLDKKIHFLCCY